MKLIYSTALMLCLTYYGHVDNGHNKHGRIGITDSEVSHIIERVYVDSPACRAGLLPGDRILHVNDVDIQGPAYTYVELTIQRGDTTLKFIIERLPWEEVSTKYEIRKSDCAI